MITAVHALIYSDDPEATRAFFRDVLRWPFVQVEGSVPPWPIFKTGPSELGVHPTSGGEGDHTYSTPRHHSVSLMCDDIEATRAELAGRGATFTDEITAYGFGRGINLDVPGAGEILLYQPRHPEAYDL